MPSLTTATRRKPGVIDMINDLTNDPSRPISAGIPLVENATILTPTGGFLAAASRWRP